MGREPLLELELQGFESERARERHAATLYLQAATKTHDAARRSSLRRRAAKLILPSMGRRLPIDSETNWLRPTNPFLGGTGSPADAIGVLRGQE